MLFIYFMQSNKLPLYLPAESGFSAAAKMEAFKRTVRGEKSKS